MNDGALAFLELSFGEPLEDVALDEALLLSAEDGGGPPVLRLWEAPRYAVVLGRSGRAQEEIDPAACLRDDVPVLRRCSGGGAVLLGPGCLVFSLVLPVEPVEHLHNIVQETARVLGRLAAALKPHVPAIAQRGTSDLAVGGRKVSGNSQRWLRRVFLHHGTLLYDFDVERVARYLRPPPREPEYRAGRPHEEFLTNLPLDGAMLRRIVAEAWGAGEPMPAPPLELTRRLAREKYANPAWTDRR